MRGNRHHHERRRPQRGPGCGCARGSPLTPGPRVLVPANRLDRAKGRLASLLSPAERVHLFLTTLTTVVGAVSACGLDVTVLTADRRVRGRMPAGVEVMGESRLRHGLNAQLEHAIAGLKTPRVMILHADLPLASPEAIRQLLSAAPRPPAVTIVRSLDGGTNAMLLDPPGGYALAYGPSSFERHVEAATAAGYTLSVPALPALALDIDTVDDLWALLESAEGRGSPAGQLLQSMALRERLREAL